MRNTRLRRYHGFLSSVPQVTPVVSKSKGSRVSNANEVETDPLAALRPEFEALVAKINTPRALQAAEALFAATGAELGALAHAHAKAELERDKFG